MAERTAESWVVVCGKCEQTVREILAATRADIRRAAFEEAACIVRDNIADWRRVAKDADDQQEVIIGVGRAILSAIAAAKEPTT